MGRRPEVTVIIQFPNNQASSRMNSNQSHKTPYDIKPLRKRKKISLILSPLKHYFKCSKTAPALMTQWWSTSCETKPPPQKGCFSDSCSYATVTFTGLAVLQSWKLDFCHLDCQLQSYKRFRFTGWTKFYLKLFRTKRKQFDSNITL